MKKNDCVQDTPGPTAKPQESSWRPGWEEAMKQVDGVSTRHRSGDLRLTTKRTLNFEPRTNLKLFELFKPFPV